MYVKISLFRRGLSAASILAMLSGMMVIPVSQAALTDNQAATDLLGAYDGTDLAHPQPSFTKRGLQNGPNRFGFDVPQGAVVDTVHHRLFVADTNNNRVLVFNLDATNKPLDHVADYVLGQPDFVSNTAATTQSTTRAVYAVAYDATHDRLFVSDAGSQRVLVYDTTTIVNGENAVNVLGQANFTSSTASVSQGGLSGPRQMAYDEANQRLFVTQASGNRVSVFDVSTITDGKAATNVLGQSTFSSSTAATTQTGLNNPSGAAYDATNQRLFIADSINKRVMVFDVNSITDGEPAVNVLGESSYTVTTTGTASTQLNAPASLAYDSINQRLFVSETGSNHRVTVFNVSSITNGQAAVNVIGQTGFGLSGPATTQTRFNTPYGLALDEANNALYVVDGANYRVMLFDVTSVSNGQAATDMIGQYTSVTDPALPPLYTKSGANAGPNELGLNVPMGMALDTVHHRYFQTDNTNSRVLVFNLNTDNSFPDKIPDNVLGQPDFNSSAPSTSQSGMNSPRDVAYDPVKDRLYVAEFGSNRVKVYDTATIINGENAVNVLGQSTFTSSTANTTQPGLNGPTGLALDVTRQHLFVAQESGNRISVFDVDTVTDNENAIAMIGQTAFTGASAATAQNRLNMPEGMYYDAPNSRLYVADSNNYRVLVFDVTTPTTGQNATNVLGQTLYTTATISTTQSSTNAPFDVSLDETNHMLYVAQTANRVTVFDVATITNGENAVNVLGQPDFTSTSSATTTANSLLIPKGVLYDSTLNRLFVSQSSTAARVSIFSFVTLPTFTVTQSGGTTAVTEGGATDSFTVVLNAQPATDVVFDVSSSDTTSATVSPAQLTFTSANWNTPQTVTVTAPEDADVVSETPVITISVNDAASDDAWDPVADQTVTVAVTDNDTAGFSIVQSGGTTAVTEGGATDSFTVVLTAQPSSNVVFDVTSSDTSAATVSPSALTFTTANWNTPQTVTVTAPEDADTVSETPVITVSVNDAASDNAWDPLADQTVNVAVTDNDTAGFSIVQSGGTTAVTEGGATDSFTVVLTAQPSSNVVFDISSSNSSAASVSPAQLTFTTANWNTPQTVTVTAPEDGNSINETPVLTISVNDAASDDAWDPLADQTVNVTVTDNDLPGFTISQSGGTTAVTEGGATDSFTVVLNAQPATDVVFDVSSSDTTSATVSPAQLTFTNANWNTPQTVTVTAPEDADVVSETPVITISVNDAASDDAWDALADQAVNVAVTDNDTAGFTITQSGGTTAVTEGGATDSFDVVLTAQPTTDVVLSVASNDMTAATVDLSSLTFTSANWNTPQTVTVTAPEDADVVSENPVITVSVNDPSSDNDWDPLADQTVNVAVTDNDTAGFTISQSGGTTAVTEGGATDSFDVVLTAQPSSDVVFDISSNDTSAATVSPATLTFTSGNWNIPQSVTVTAPEDLNSISETPAITISVNDAASDDAWDPLADQTVNVTVTDNDIPGFSIVQSGGTTNVTEGGATDSFTVVLTAQPTTDVVFDISSSDTSAATVSPATLTFTSANWNTPQTVTVTAPEDADTVSETPVITVSVNDAASDDGWDPLADQTVTVNVTDNDTPNISVVETAGATAVTEGGATDTLTAVLTAQPSSDVVVSVTSSDTSAMTASPATLTFTSANWNTPQTITVTAPEDDDIVSETPTLTLSVVDASSDDAWDGLADIVLNVAVTDNDSAGFSITESGGSTAVTEGGATDSFDVVLTAQPSSDVVLSVLSSDVARLTASPATLTFTSANWNTPQTVTAAALQDADAVSENLMFTVTVVDASSDDAWDVLPNQIVNVAVTDDDTPGFTVTESAGTTAVTEEGATDTISVVLNVQPSSDVVFTVVSSDPAQATVSPATLTFTTANWNTPQIVTVSAPDDADTADGAVTVTIAVDDAASDDLFDPLADQTVNVAVTDNDSMTPPAPPATPPASIFTGGGGGAAPSAAPSTVEPPASNSNTGSVDATHGSAPEENTNGEVDQPPATGTGSTLFVQPWLAASFGGSGGGFDAVDQSTPWYGAFAWYGNQSLVSTMPSLSSTIGDMNVTTAKLPTKIEVCGEAPIPRQQLTYQFQDTHGHWAEADIEALAAAGVLQGIDATRFEPDRPITRAESLKVVIEMFCYRLPETILQQSFPDIPADAWYTPYVASGKIFGVVTGYLPILRSGSVVVKNLEYEIQNSNSIRPPSVEETSQIAAKTFFLPQQFVSRAEGLSMLMRSAKMPVDATMAKLPEDVSADAWYATTISTALRLGLVQATDHFRPEEPMSRAEMARLLMNYERMKNTNLTNN